MTKENNEQKFLPPTAEQTASGQIWARMEKDGNPFEPAKAYQAFLSYCDFGAERSLAALIKTGAVKIAKRNLEKYSAKFDWQRRAFAYDRYIAILEQNARDVARFNAQRKWTERREIVRENDWNTAQELRRKAKELLAMPLIETEVVEETSDDGQTVQLITKTPVRGSLNDAVRMLELGDKLQRNAVGAETDRIIIGTPESKRLSDVQKARAAFARSAELFPHKPETERAEHIAHAFGVTVSEIVAAEEILTSIVQEKVSDLIN